MVASGGNGYVGLYAPEGHHHVCDLIQASEAIWKEYDNRVRMCEVLEFPAFRKC